MRELYAFEPISLDEFLYGPGLLVMITCLKPFINYSYMFGVTVSQLHEMLKLEDCRGRHPRGPSCDRSGMAVSIKTSLVGMYARLGDLKRK